MSTPRRAKAPWLAKSPTTPHPIILSLPLRCTRCVAILESPRSDLTRLSVVIAPGVLCREVVIPLGRSTRCTYYWSCVPVVPVGQFALGHSRSISSRTAPASRALLVGPRLNGLASRLGSGTSARHGPAKDFAGILLPASLRTPAVAPLAFKPPRPPGARADGQF